MTDALAEAIKREKKRLPFGWGRFGKAIDHLGELLGPAETIEMTAVGVYSRYREQHPFGHLGAGKMNVLIGVTNRRLLLIGTSLAGNPLDHHTIPWDALTEFTVLSEKKRHVAVGWPDGGLSVDSIAKSAFRDLLAAMAAHTHVGRAPQ